MLLGDIVITEYGYHRQILGYRVKGGWLTTDTRKEAEHLQRAGILGYTEDMITHELFYKIKHFIIGL